MDTGALFVALDLDQKMLHWLVINWATKHTRDMEQRDNWGEHNAVRKILLCTKSGPSPQQAEKSL